MHALASAEYRPGRKPVDRQRDERNPHIRAGGNARPGPDVPSHVIQPRLHLPQNSPHGTSPRIRVVTPINPYGTFILNMNEGPPLEPVIAAATGATFPKFRASLG